MTSAVLIASQAEFADAELVGAEVVGQLMAHGAQDLGVQLVRVVPEVAQEGVAEDDDAVRRGVARDRVTHVEAVGTVAAALVGMITATLRSRAPRRMSG